MTRNILSMSVLVVSLGGLCTGTLAGQENRVIELPLPHLPERNESVEIQIRTGPLPRGARLVLMDPQGEVFGTVTPFPLGSATTATVPVPRTAIVDGRLQLRLQVKEPGAPPRAPRVEEVQRLDPVLVPQGE
jgi:hypothetical protein